MDGSFGAVVLGGFSMQKPLVPELPCGEESLLLIQVRARKAARKPAAREEAGRAPTGLPAPRVGSRHPRWAAGTHGGGAGHGVWEPGKGAGRCCLPAPSAGTGLAALPAHSAAQHPPGNPGSPGDPRMPECPSQGWRAMQGPTLALPSCQARQARGGAVLPKGRAGVLPMAAHAGNPSLHRAGRLLLPSTDAGDTGPLWELTPTLVLSGGI